MSVKITKIVISLSLIEVFLEDDQLLKVFTIERDPSAVAQVAAEALKTLECENTENIDVNIVVALALDKNYSQLKMYIDLCDRVSKGDSIIDLGTHLPEIIYDLRGLRDK